MSLDLYVHCKSPKRLTTKQLSTALAAGNIGAAFFEDSVSYKQVTGPIADCAILGWLPSQFDSAKLFEMLEAGNKKKLEQLFAKETVGYANVFSSKAKDGNDILMLTVNSKTRYRFSTSLARTPQIGWAVFQGGDPCPNPRWRCCR